MNTDYVKMKITNVIKCRTIVVCTNKTEQLLIMLAVFMVLSCGR
jgi:hypothetical protein